MYAPLSQKPVTLGTPIEGRLIQVDPNIPLSVGTVYQVNIETRGVQDPLGTLGKLNNLLVEQGIQMIYGEVVEDTIIIQLKPQQSGLSLNIFFTLLPLIGIAITSILAFVVAWIVPKWVWGVGAVTIGLLLIAPLILKKFEKY